MANIKQRVSLEAARKTLLPYAAATGTESLPFADSFGRVASETIFSSVYVPPFDRSSVDGYAFRAQDVIVASPENSVTLKITEEITAGYMPKVEVTPLTAAKVLTGAPVPKGADCVIRFEETEFTEQTVKISSPVKKNINVVPMGEDIRQGDIILNKGEIISSAHIGLLASVDCLKILVNRRPRVALINTGDEITEPGTPMAQGQIRNSSRYTIAAILRENGAEVDDGYIVKDECEPLAACLTASLEKCDMVITTGGVSVGDYDMVRRAVNLLGGEELFWKVAFRPGGTILAAMSGGKIILGLSGNPASAVLGLNLLGLPFLRLLSGQADVYPKLVKTRLIKPILKDSQHGRLVRGRLTSEEGLMCFAPISSEGHGAVSSIIGCDMIASIPPGTPPLSAGETIDAFWLSSLTRDIKG